MTLTTLAPESTNRMNAAWSRQITDNERAWIEFIRLASYDTDPSPTLDTIQKLRDIFRVTGQSP